MKRCIIAFSSKNDNEEAFSEVENQISAEGQNPILIIFFAQSDCFAYAAELFKKKFPDTVSIGSTTYKNFCSQGYGIKGLSAIAIFHGIEVGAGALFHIGVFPGNYSAHIIKAKNQLSSLENTCCLEFSTAFSNGEELVLDTLNENLKDSDITVVGSSSGSANNGDNRVALNGEVYKNTCVFCLIHNLQGKIFYYKENIFRATKHSFIATNVDCENRIVYEYNNQPATDILAETLGVSFDELEELLVKHPMGRLLDNQIYITESNEIKPKDGSISYFSRIYNLTKMYLMELEDVAMVNQQTKIYVEKMIKNPSFTISINCLSRSMMFEKDNYFETFNNFLKNSFGDFIGISGYGEQLNNIHLNESMVLVLFE